MGKLLFVIALCLSFTALAGAYDVINIDINGSASDPCYTGLGPFQESYSGAVVVNEWNGFYQENGVMIASPRCVGIGDPCNPSSFARALFMADPCSHTYLPYAAGDDLQDDGFQKDGVPADPNPGLFFWGDLAYNGVYDVYVISNAIGDFTIRDSNGDTQSASLSGGGGAWAEGTNYVKFEEVEINTPASSTAAGADPAYATNQTYLADTNSVLLTYSNQIDGIQFASVKRRIMNNRGVPPDDPNFDECDKIGSWSAETPIVLPAKNLGVFVFAADYDVGYDTNMRDGEFDYDGPDADYASGKIHYIAPQEQWEYDFIVDDVGDGGWQIRFLTNLYWGDAEYAVYIDDSLQLGKMIINKNEGIDANIPYWSTAPEVTADPAQGYLDLNFFQGFRTLKIKSLRPYFDFQGFNLYHLAGKPNMNDCETIIAYGYGLDGDTNSDCYVNFDDLKAIVDDWASCNDPCEGPVEEPEW